MSVFYANLKQVSKKRQSPWPWGVPVAHLSSLYEIKDQSKDSDKDDYGHCAVVKQLQQR